MSEHAISASILAGAMAALVAVGAAAHSLDRLEQRLFDRERYFEIKAAPAPAFALQDADGNPVGPADFRGKVVILHFVYASCPDVCPLHAEKLAEVQGMINMTPMQDGVEFVTVTTDPLRDGPDVLRAYGDVHGLSPVNWVFLTSGPDLPQDTTRRLAEAYGHGFTTGDDGLQMHAIVTHIIDRKGRWRANFHGLEFNPTNLVVYVNALVNDNDTHQSGRPGRDEDSLWERLRSLF